MLSVINFCRNDNQLPKWCLQSINEAFIYINEGFVFINEAFVYKNRGFVYSLRAIFGEFAVVGKEVCS